MPLRLVAALILAAVSACPPCWAQDCKSLAPGVTPVVLSVSAYSPEETMDEDGGQRRTAAGNMPRHGVAAISRDLYDAGWTFGRRVCVKGWGVFVLDDLMGPGRTHGLDLFMDTRELALDFGRRKLRVRLLPEP